MRVLFAKDPTVWDSDSGPVSTRVFYTAVAQLGPLMKGSVVLKSLNGTLRLEAETVVEIWTRISESGSATLHGALVFGGHAVAESCMSPRQPCALSFGFRVLSGPTWRLIGS